MDKQLLNAAHNVREFLSPWQEMGPYSDNGVITYVYSIPFNYFIETLKQGRHIRVCVERQPRAIIEKQSTCKQG